MCKEWKYLWKMKWSEDGSECMWVNLKIVNEMNCFVICECVSLTGVCD